MTSIDYWRMSDNDLEKLASEFRIGGYGGQGGFIDRDVIIRNLLKRDEALRPQTPTHNVHIDQMIGSSIQQGTSNSTATVNFQANNSQLGELVQHIKNIASQIELSQDSRTELDADMKTLDAQLSSPKPKPSIIRSCLESAKTILEGAAKSALTTAIGHEIAKYLGS